MQAIMITSTGNTKVRRIAAYMEKSKARREDDVFIVEGIRMNAEIPQEKILETYVAREDVEKYAKKASMEEIVENGYNLNIPRYVDTFEEEEKIDIQAVKEKYVELETEAKEIEKKIEEYFAELGI